MNAQVFWDKVTKISKIPKKQPSTCFQQVEYSSVYSSALFVGSLL